MTLGRRGEVVELGGALHYTGLAQPDPFRSESRDHHVREPVVIESETRLL